MGNFANPSVTSDTLCSLLFLSSKFISKPFGFPVSFKYKNFITTQRISNHNSCNAREELDLSEVGSIVAPHSHRHVLAAIKHFDVIPTASDTEWARHVLNDNSYIEAIFTERFSRKDIHKIRVLKENYDELWNLAFSDFGMKLTGAEKALVSDFTTVVKGNKQGLFVLEVLSP